MGRLDMFKAIDRSRSLSRLIAIASESVAKRRGLPVIIGILITLLGFICQLINYVAPSPTLHLIGFVSQSVGTLIALIGLLVSDALGK